MIIKLLPHANSVTPKQPKKVTETKSKKMGRIPTGKVPKQELKHLKTHHMKIIYLLLAGATAAQISKHLGMSQSRISIIRRSPIFRLRMREERQKLYAKMQDNEAAVQTRIGHIGDLALDFMEGALDPLDENYENVSFKEKRLIAQHVTEMADMIPGKGSDRIRALNGGGGGAADFTSKFINAAFEKALEDHQRKLLQEEKDGALPGEVVQEEVA